MPTRSTVSALRAHHHGTRVTGAFRRKVWLKSSGGTPDVPQDPMLPHSPKCGHFTNFTKF